MTETRTSEKILDAALESFGGPRIFGHFARPNSCWAGIRKQTILYWFPNKEALLGAVVDRSAAELTKVLEEALSNAGDGWERVEAVVRATFRLAANRPELLGLVREAGRLGPVAAGRLTEGINPLLGRAADFLEAEMNRGVLRKHDAHFFLLSAYSVVIGVVTETEVLRALGMELTPRAYVLRRNEVINFLKSALVPQ